MSFLVHFLIYVVNISRITFIKKISHDFIIDFVVIVNLWGKKLTKSLKYTPNNKFKHKWYGGKKTSQETFIRIHKNAIPLLHSHQCRGEYITGKIE